ncbi:MAG: hypothetical protein RIR70_2205, partial [Pseudomonadota bacterium]
ATRGRMVNECREFSGISTDSRKIAAGTLFVALRGEFFDGHDFIHHAAAAGAVAAMVDEAWAVEAAVDTPVLDPKTGKILGFPLVVVDDTRLALGRMAAYWRSNFSLPLVGVTGSNGKTSVKEMIAAIFRAQSVIDGFVADDSVLATEGNLNNDIGVPLMLLRLKLAHRAAVIEMGMNHPGEIAWLTSLAKPTVALVTNAQRAHLAGVGTLADVAEEKGAIFSGLSADGVAVINADDTFADLWRENNRDRKILTFGLNPGADVTARFTARGLTHQVALTTPFGATEFTLHVPGVHNVRNALAAAAATLSAGATLEAVANGLSGWQGVKGRLNLRRSSEGALVIDDTYNANPDSVRAGIDVLAATPGPKILVLGDMGEIGERSAQYHDEIGGYAKSAGVDALFSLGELSELAARNFGEHGQHFKTPEALIDALKAQLKPDATVLVKGSRFMRMERISDAIAPAAPTKDTH